MNQEGKSYNTELQAIGKTGMQNCTLTCGMLCFVVMNTVHFNLFMSLDPLLWPTPGFKETLALSKVVSSTEHVDS